MMMITQSDTNENMFEKMKYMCQNDAFIDWTTIESLHHHHNDDDYDGETRDHWI